MNSPDKFLSTPFAVLLGSFLISIAILIHGGFINLDKITGKTNVSTKTSSISDPVIQNLKAGAAELGLDQEKFDLCLDSGEKASLVKTDYNEGNAAGVEGTPNFFINGHIVAGLFPYPTFKQIIDFELAGGDWNNPSSDVKFLVDGNPENGEIGIDKVNVGVGNLPPLGQESAPVTVIEFSDYECPVCGAFYDQAEKQFIADYVDTGKVKFYYRDFPISQIHPGAQKGAEAARCAGDQGKYWEYHNLIFENQAQIF